MRKRKSSEKPKSKTLASKKSGTRKSKVSSNLKNKSSNINSNIEVSSEISIDKFAARALTIYGSYVVEERAVPDIRDGLKPVHRYILWAMQELGLNSKAAYKKSARTIGDVLGKYHPHGDQAAYGAMATLANYKRHNMLVQGQGNWGTPVDNHAAMRYTEARLGALADIFLLDKGYLKTVPMVDNFDQTLKVPLYLPATLPMMLVTGNSGIGFGIAASNPPFAIEGVYKIVVAALKAYQKDKKIGVKACSKHLEIQYPFGCHTVSSDEEFESLIKTGKGTIKFVPDVQANWEEKTIDIKSFSPGFRSTKTIKKALEKIASWPEVSKAGNNSSLKNPKAGPIGAYYYIKTARGLSEDSFYDLADKVLKEVTGSESYDLGFTIRKHEEKNAFVKSNFPQFINNWVQYRVGLEKDYIQILINEKLATIEVCELKIFAVDHRKQILESLNSKDPDSTLCKKLKISKEYAKRILDLQVRRLATLEKKALQDQIKDLKSEIRTLKQEDANPVPRILKVTKDQYAQYCKWVDKFS